MVEVSSACADPLALQNAEVSLTHRPVTVEISGMGSPDETKKNSHNGRRSKDPTHSCPWPRPERAERARVTHLASCGQRQGLSKRRGNPML